MKSFSLMLLLILCSSVQARDYRSIGLKDRVIYSDVIAVVSVKSVGSKYKVGEGMPQFYSAVEVIELIKGDSNNNVLINFITEGLVPERNPMCCRLGDRYLIFGIYGYPELETNEAMEDAFVLKEVGKFVSPTDGPYSTFRVSNGLVEGWGRRKSRGVSLPKVISIIKNEIENVSD